MKNIIAFTFILPLLSFLLFHPYWRIMEDKERKENNCVNVILINNTINLSYTCRIRNITYFWKLFLIVFPPLPLIMTTLKQLLNVLGLLVFVQQNEKMTEQLKNRANKPQIWTVPPSGLEL